MHFINKFIINTSDNRDIEQQRKIFGQVTEMTVGLFNSLLFRLINLQISN